MDDIFLVRLAKQIEFLVQQDPGNRGLAGWAVKDHLLPSARSLLSGDHCLVFTGFYVSGTGSIETDGPLGAVVLAQALERLGRRPTILTDRHGSTIIGSALGVAGFPADLLTFETSDPVASEEIISTATTHLVAIERPGLAEDGCHHNMRGHIISEHVAPLDGLFVEGSRRGLVTIGIGDGGNELGMGNTARAVGTFILPGQAYACTIPSDFCICAGVSNWGAYALAAVLSLVHGTNLLLEPAVLSVILDRIVEAGAVDGVTGERTPTVDNLPRSWEMEIYETLYRIVEGHGG